MSLQRITGALSHKLVPALGSFAHLIRISRANKNFVGKELEKGSGLKLDKNGIDHQGIDFRILGDVGQVFRL